MKPKRTESESDLQQAIRLALGRDHDLVLWRNTGGVAVHGSGNTQRFGLCRGATDLVGVLTVGGVGIAVFIEVKTQRGRLSPEQIMFGDLVTKRGAVYGVARSVADAREIIDRARHEYAWRYLPNEGTVNIG